MHSDKKNYRGTEHENYRGTKHFCLSRCREGDPIDDERGKQPASQQRRINGARARTGTAPACCSTPPPECWTKINVDGSFLELSGARDNNGQVIFSACRFYERCASALEAEALACVEGLCWASQRGVSQAVIE